MNLTMIVIIKEKEKGLLSIADGRCKSMVPLLGKARILDFYLYPAKNANFIKIYTILKPEHVNIKDYISHQYRDYPVHVHNNNSILEGILKIVKREKSPILLVYADGFLSCNWNFFAEELFDYGNRNKVISFSRGNNDFAALYIGVKEDFYDLITEKIKPELDDAVGYDEVWINLIGVAVKSYGKEHISSKIEYYSLKTVKEYYDFHISLLSNMDKCFEYSSIFQDETLKEGNDTTVSVNGFVRNSYISSSSYIEGEIEESFIFSNVKVSKDAYVYRSIIMNNNSIAEGSRLEKIILCDEGELQGVIPRVNENAVLGGRRKDGYNKDFPEYIYGGISLIGRDVDIPRGFQMAENCYISSGTGKLILKEKKRLLSGESLINR